MQTYLVGGCVRDKLLGKPVKDRDWVVVGATTDYMLEKGYKPVGKDFPVFLHPKTQEEYALARTERKSGHGYQGFTVYASPEVTLEEDLARRDLTINAIAESVDGNIIDPFNGIKDLEKGILRHVSPAFVEDPVRVLRIARFAARFNFAIAGETQQLIRQMVSSGELEHLVAERVWQELSKALQTDQPSVFFTSLRQVDALSSLFPEVDRLFGVPQIPKWHPEVDTGIHVMMVIDQAAKLTDDLAVRFSALCHDLGKGLTPKDILPSHAGHEASSIALTEKLCQRLRVPKVIATLAAKVAEYHTDVHLLFELDAARVLDVIEGLDSFRRPQRFEQFLLAGEADFRGRPGYETADYPEKKAFSECFQQAAQVDVKPLLEEGLAGEQIKQAIRQHRCDAIEGVLSTYRTR
ncbi:multifunctional CCA addition/repair protein [Methylophaga sulfidovorans]|uniref:multifunctional CCA addition/repair protein n=1 Tax=Methylophaga sulfidovorans TaxID=45496 RepID=UPI000B825802|nr:multifunctional CCA addition/repair protein [Methylophaga sulfidovorans]